MVVRLSDVRNGAREYDSLDDRMLVLDFQAGHPAAFVEIHKRYGGLARHVCRRLLTNAHDSDEAFQETMIRVFQGLHRFNGRFALQPWISRIATNVSLDVIRSRARRPVFDERVEEFEHVDLDDGPEEAFERLVERDLVLAVLSDLPDTHRRALILRELEGRSHREIGEAIGISPAQAKALIHRAKGSFRRRWMQKAVERGGITGFALLPLVWLARLSDTVRRVADRAGHTAQAAQAAVPDVVSTASQTVVTAAGGGFGERVIAASMTLIVAGGVTVGAATIVKDRGEPERGIRAEAAVTAPAPVVDPVELANPKPQPTFDDTPPKEVQGPPEILDEPVVTEPSAEEETTPAAGSPAPEPTQAPPPEPSGEPSPSPTPTPTPPPAPPAYQFSFDSAVPFSSLCPCGLGVRRVSSTVTPGKQGSLYVRETLAVTGIAQGTRAFDLWIEYEATLSGSGGSLTTSFYVETPDDAWYAYNGSATAITANRTEFGTDYVATGTYQRTSMEVVSDEVPAAGPLTVTLRTWGDAPVLYGVTISLGA